jgi:hypothetical protein
VQMDQDRTLTVSLTEQDKLYWQSNA